MELTAFVVSDSPGWIIEPRALEREWMDQTPNRFAYRCLPLVMANQAGWIVRCPIGFRARWVAGDDYRKSVEIHFDADAPRWTRWISSHFGSGVLTFALPWLFRTPRPMLLRVSGLPNFWKEGAIGLEGLVETYWSPYTFTMNWKLTRPGIWTRFNLGDPICFLQPSDPAAAEGLEPRIRALAENPELKAEFEAWNKARTEFIHDPNRGTSWQKNYFQGKTMAGAEEGEHRSKVSVKGLRRGRNAHPVASASLPMFPPRTAIPAPTPILRSRHRHSAPSCLPPHTPRPSSACIPTFPRLSHSVHAHPNPTFIEALDARDEVKSEGTIRDGQGINSAPADYLAQFSQWVKANPDHIAAIEILLSRRKDWSTQALTELRSRLNETRQRFNIDTLQQAHEQHYKEALIDVISVIKHGANDQHPLLTATERVDRAIAALSGQ